MDFKRVVDKRCVTNDVCLPRYEVHNKNDIVKLWSDFNERLKPTVNITCNPRLLNNDIKFALNQHVVEITTNVTDNWNEYGFLDVLKPSFQDRVIALVQKYATITAIQDEDNNDDSDFDDVSIH